MSENNVSPEAVKEIAKKLKTIINNLEKATDNIVESSQDMVRAANTLNVYNGLRVAGSYRSQEVGSGQTLRTKETWEVWQITGQNFAKSTAEETKSAALEVNAVLEGLKKQPELIDMIAEEIHKYIIQIENSIEGDTSSSSGKVQGGSLPTYSTTNTTGTGIPIKDNGESDKTEKKGTMKIKAVKKRATSGLIDTIKVPASILPNIISPGIGETITDPEVDKPTDEKDDPLNNPETPSGDTSNPINPSTDPSEETPSNNNDSTSKIPHSNTYDRNYDTNNNIITDASSEEENPSVLDEILESTDELTNSADKANNKNNYIKIPTSKEPIKTSSSNGSKIIPIAAGLAATAAVGIGAKAYMSRKENSNNEDDEEFHFESGTATGNDNGIMAEEWQGEGNISFSEPEQLEEDNNYLDQEENIPLVEDKYDARINSNELSNE